MRVMVMGLGLIVAQGAACAQTAGNAQPAVPQGSEDVVRAADDAFGRRVGAEQIGLYSETEVRGFNLQSAGNYRIDDHYFVRASGLFIAMDDGTAIRVGANGLRTDFAAPSGVVQYALPSAAAGEARLSVETGWWGGSGPTLVARYGLASGDGAWSIAGGAQANPWQRYTDGTDGLYYAGGLVPRWRPRPGVEVAAVLAKSWFKRGADTMFATPDGREPPRIRRNRNRAQDWMEPVSNSTLAGVMASAETGGWAFGGSAFYSDAEDPLGIFNLYGFTGQGRAAQNSVLATPLELARSVSAELTAARSFATGRLSHRLHAMVRRRDSLTRTSPGDTRVLGQVPDADAPPAFARPDFAFDARRVRDSVGQWAGGLGYRLSIGSLLELRADVQKVAYRKQVASLDGAVRRETTRPWLYSASAALGASPELTLFASYARGLEEAGVAPGNATNRGAVLPATLARQAELGVKYAVPDGPSLIAGLFDISKPMPGLGTDGVYGFVGEVRHRGVELSLAGPLTPRLSTVLGATLLDADLSGELVDRGTIGAKPIGRPELIALANLTWQTPWLDGLALDGGVSFRGARQANRENSAELPAYATVQLGMRQRFELAGAPVTLRARVSNLLDAFAWNATGSGLFTTNGPRTFTLTLTGEI